MPEPNKKRRLDIELVARGLAETRERAQALILAGKVTLDGQKAGKAGQPVSNESRLEVAEPLKYVSRGGVKLEAAIKRFQVVAAGRLCLDVGTSTGGFTDCLLQQGAAKVHCVDTGAGQIDWRLRTDSRVALHESFNARYLTLETLNGEHPSLIVCDVSFISVTLIVKALAGILTTDGEMVILVKPQFEVGREAIGKGGIVRDKVMHQRACDRVSAACLELGFAVELMPSPILGTEGNREFLLHAKRAPVLD
jgi:23S rRNA (cytidine1920-2'-O)/16S rRNA (cytidine1409-2'-O)-methyltransferase